MVTSEMAMKQANIRFTYSDYLLLPEDKRYEILEGELYVIAAPNTKHQRVSKRLVVALTQRLEKEGLGEVFIAPYDVVLSEDNVLQPDIVFVCKNRAGVVGELNLTGAPDLAVEILSPGSRGKDLEIKRKIYARFGVQEYWVVDPDAETIEVLAWGEIGYSTAGMFAKSDSLTSPQFPDLNLPLPEIFE